MLSRLFDKARALDHRDPAVRLGFLNDLAPEKAAELQDRLMDLIGRETAAEIRAAALRHISGIERLTALFSRHEHLRGELAEWIATKATPDHDLCRRHPEIARARLLHTDSEAEQNSLLTLFPGLEERVELALKARAALKSRILGLPELANELAYTTLERLSRGHDKSVNRHARERLDGIKSIDDNLKAVRDRAATINSAVATLAKQAPATPAARESRRRQLLALQAELRTVMDREQAAIQEASTIGASRESSVTLQCFDGLDLEPPRESPFSQLLASLPPAVMWLESGNPGGAAPALAALQAQWEEVKTLTPPSAEEIRQLAAMEEEYAAVLGANDRLAALQWPELPSIAPTLPEADAKDFWRGVQDARRALNRHHKAEKTLAWPERLPVPQILAEARQHRITLATTLEAIDALHAQLLRDIQSALGEAESLIHAGQSKLAQARLAPLRRELGRLMSEPAQKLKVRLDGLFHRLGELKDWQTFATSPKREELLARMKELIGIAVEPEQLSARIKRVREQWNQLGAPVNKHEHSLREAFETAAAEAFEPCRLWFAEQDRIREGHLGKRQSLVAMLRDYVANTDWQAADYHAAEQILQTARREWQAAFPLPRGDHKALVTDFEGLQTRLHDIVHAHYKAASDRKRALIDTLRAARDTTPIADQVENVKRLQQQWKEIGAGLRSQEQALWREFREVCDAVFKDRAAAAEEHKIAQNAQLSRAAEQNRQLAATLAAWTGETANPAVLRDARAAFNDIGDLGRDGRALVDEHRRLIRDGESKLATIAASRRRERLDHIRAIDTALDGGEPVEIDPKLRSYFSNRTAGDSETLQELVLLAEIAAGRESPPAEQRRRMAIQVDLMNRRAGMPDAETLLKRWCSLADKSADTNQRSRFWDAVATLF